MEKGIVQIIGNGNSASIQFEHLLESEGYVMQQTLHLDGVQDVVLRDKPSAVIIDLDEFGDRAWSACVELKDDLVTRKSALILLSSVDDENLRIKGLESGADDFVAKPYSPREMIARIKAIARRISSGDAKKIRVKDIEIDLDEHRVRKAGKPIDLTYIQFKLLYLLASRRNNVFSRKEILEKVWGKKVYVTNRTVDVHIKRLREKLGEYKYPSQYIETIHGTGYRFL
ncbi:response regulator transcription factor [candidate division KSB1 bacterium]|nr:response regulator transcription factor [candidate division KSB1 bacterium]